MPKVSVVIPVYNGERTIGRALDSVFAQTFSDFESRRRRRRLDRRYRVGAGLLRRSNPRRQRRPIAVLPAARNTGVRASARRVRRVSRRRRRMDAGRSSRDAPPCSMQDRDCALVYTLARQSRYARAADGRAESGQPDPTGVDSPTMKQMLARPWNVVPSQFIVRRDVVERCGGFDERCWSCEDLEFLLRAREYGHFQCVPELLRAQETRPLYPKALEREPDCELFVELVRERYGASADGLIRELSALAGEGHAAIRPHSDRRGPARGRAPMPRARHPLQPASPKAYYDT